MIEIAAFFMLISGSLSNWNGNSTAKISSEKEIFLTEKISVRESNFDLQVTVKDKIFVFGKAKGTLDKIKVGMNVLPFCQAPENEVNPNEFSKVTWKKLKDGSIQIQSSYNPWPSTLSWIVYADGRLKMEASAPPTELVNARWLGLGFNFPDQMLNQISWNTGSVGGGEWKNQNYIPMANPEIEIESQKSGFFQQVRSVRLDFESVSLEVNAENTEVVFGLGDNPSQDNSYPKLKSDMVFLFNRPNQQLEKPSQSPSGDTDSKSTQLKTPLVLWFHFQ